MKQERKKANRQSAEKNNFGQLENFLRELINKLHSTRRWMAKKNPTSESVLEHTFKQAFLGFILIRLEQRYGKKDFMAFKLLSCLFLHDAAESIMGDIPFAVKHDPRVSEGLKTIEKEQFSNLIKGLFSAELKEDLENVYALQYDENSFENKLFQATELLGYILFAMPEAKNGKDNFREVLKNCSARLKPLTAELASARIFYQTIKTEVEQLIKC